MLEINIPGAAPLHLTHLILDYNGTLAADGLLLEGVPERLKILAERLEIHIVTADTFGSVRAQVSPLPVKLIIIPSENQAQGKADYLATLGSANAAAMGNGRNDRLMLEKAALGIATLQGEGAAREALLAADVVTPGITDALDLLLYPDRLKATLRV